MIQIFIGAYIVYEIAIDILRKTANRPCTNVARNCQTKNQYAICEKNNFFSYSQFASVMGTSCAARTTVGTINFKKNTFTRLINIISDKSLFFCLDVFSLNYCKYIAAICSNVGINEHAHVLPWPQSFFQCVGHNVLFTITKRSRRLKP